MATTGTTDGDSGGRPPPNILVILADQVVPFLTSPYGDPVARTPNLQRLADEGVRFDAAYTASPLCAPARAALIAGRDASALGCFDNASVMPSDVPTMGHYLTNQGYDTVLSGKMHFIGPDQLHGFRRRLTTDVFPAGVDWVPVVDEEGRFPAGGHARHYSDPDPGVRTWTQFLDFDEETQHRALQYLRERGRTGAAEPFGMVVSFHHPHDPFHVQQEYWDLYEGVDIPTSSWPDGIAQSVMDRWANEAHDSASYDLRDPESLRHLRRAYYAALSYIDRKIGELLHALEASGELGRTVVVFSSDHGDMMTERGMVQKRTFYEWSVRVPLTLTFPDGAHAGGVVTTPVSLIDLLPTLLDLAEVPEERRADLDGRSLLPAVRGEASGEEPVFSEYHLEKVRAPCFLVRRGRLKYVYIHGHDRQLFDLEADPNEWTDLSGRPEHAGVEAELHALLLQRFDPDALAAQGEASIPRRVIVAEAMRRNDQHWDYTPVFDGTRQYVR
ncbi:choline-sulfatase [Naasia sp. SYSU D00057]|uniref:choline-sulfatase n=1 Tax=Naasia sp. SYSU D00057 TaxID=2817380 RepID=UPI001B313DDA|nr:choline-sulfatase [Naasia sp. SYSU D00057]